MKGRTVFGVHPLLEDALNAVDEGLLPADLDEILPTQRRLGVDELDAIANLCASHVRARVRKAGRTEFERLFALSERTVTRPAGAPLDYTDLGDAARRDLEYARGLVRIAAIAAYVPSSSSGVAAAKLVGEAAAATARALARSRRNPPRCTRSSAHCVRGSGSGRAERGLPPDKS